MQKALYRKHRSRSLAELQGQPHITSVLENTLKSGHISHAYLFIGPRGTGKTSTARILAHAINDFDYQLEDTHLDIIEIDAASNTGVDNIRDLREKALIAPATGKYKVYIIDEVHMLSKAAFNALLKTLEEPPAHAVFIMATTDAHKVPITITSRAQVFTFKLASPDIIQSHLRHISTLENINITDDALALLARRSGGSFRDAISLLDQISTLSPDNSHQITASDIITALGLPTDQALADLLALYQSSDLPALTDALNSLLATGLKPDTIAEELLRHIISAPTPALIPLLTPLSEVSRHPFPVAGLLVALSTNLLQSPKIPSSPTPNPSSPQPSIISHHNRFVNTNPQNPPLSPQSPLENPPKTTPPIPTKSPSLHPPTSNSTPNPHPPTSPQLIQPTLQPPVTPETFDWQLFLQNIKTSSISVFTQLNSATYTLEGSLITIIPKTKVAKSLLQSPNNQSLLLRHLGTLTLKIAEPSPSTLPPPPASAPNLPQTPTPSTSTFKTSPTPSTSTPKTPPSSTPTSPPSPLSAIMGTVKEVTIDANDIPV